MSGNHFFAEKRLTHEDQIHFAAISGDRNPVHVDPVIARRTQFGQQIAHGMHLVLWSLDRYFAAFDAPVPSALNVRFLKPAFIDDVLSVAVAEDGTDRKRLEIVASGLTVATVGLSFGGSSEKVHAGPAGELCTTSSLPQVLDLEEIEGRKGCLPLALEVLDGAHSFPAAARTLGPEVVLSLLATSRVVGMECPGMHSIFSGLAVSLVHSGGPASGLAWRVARVDRRVRKVDLEVYGGGLSGCLETFVRMPPTRPLLMAEVCAVVDPNEFAGHCPLIVGGSRGLGEVTAKIVAAGGGTPIITYALGREEAERSAAEINASGRRCLLMQYDVKLPAAPQLAVLPGPPTSFYYFATCAIFQRKSALYEPQLMREFTSFFVDGFYALCSELRARNSGTLVGFYPSTVALEQPMRELTEYCLAKQAGEALCAQLARFMTDVRFVVRRLPRIATDQTATILTVPSMPALEVMLPIVREVHAARFP